jgi:KDO2-lipid IV(A) lauroyltransferase
VGAALGRAGYRPLGIRRAVVEEQIAGAFPEFPPERVRAVAEASYASLGSHHRRGGAAAALGPRRGCSPMAEVHGWDAFEAARAEGRGVVFVTGHLGNWELAGAYVAARGVPLDVVARSRRTRCSTASSRARASGSACAWCGTATRCAARRGRCARGAAWPSSSTRARPGWRARGRRSSAARQDAARPAVFALRLGAPVVFGAAVRRPDGRFALGFERVPVAPAGDRERDVDAIVVAYTATLERWVRRYPEQYFWQHRRWKYQPGRASGRRPRPPRPRERA